MESSAMHIAVAFVLMGSWAFYANSAHPMPKPLLAALVQGALSGAITYALKHTLDGLRARLARETGLWLPPLIALAGSLCLLVGAHMVARTPELLGTIAVPLSVASLYAITYNALMWHKEKAQ